MRHRAINEVHSKENDEHFTTPSSRRLPGGIGKLWPYWRITQEMYDQIVSEEQARQEVWEKELANFDEPDETFIVSSEYLLSLLNRLPELYERSKDDEKLEWHKLWFSNATLKQEKLHKGYVRNVTKKAQSIEPSFFLDEQVLFCYPLYIQIR